MQKIDWNTLGFRYMDTRCHVRYVWRNGAWDGGELVESPYMPCTLRPRACITARRRSKG